jgi:uncharacterized protein (DUF2235 family)
MSRNLILCADGTGNAFARQTSNVSRLVRLVEVGTDDQQLVIYDQGIGTDPSLAQAARLYADGLGNARDRLIVLDPPGQLPWVPAAAVKLCGLTFGYGLRDNVMQMYKALSMHWSSGDQVFLFGFSRGAFTVRALAGLMHRCGLLPTAVAAGDGYARAFAKAWTLYQPHRVERSAIDHFRAELGISEDLVVQIHFLGLWDTVKSYGGIWPRSLPHLRHNPSVCIVRHALALAESRSWFIPTSWGGIDGEDLERLGVQPDERYAKQQVKEVWFRGCHSDVGGGDVERATAEIPLQWMLREAVHAGLRLGADGRRLVEADLSATALETHESLRCGWVFSEYVPRWELDNSVGPPRRYFRIGRSGMRHVDQFSRGGKVHLHRSAQRDYPLRSVDIVD